MIAAVSFSSKDSTFLNQLKSPALLTFLASGKLSRLEVEGEVGQSWRPVLNGIGGIVYTQLMMGRTTVKSEK